MDSIGLSLVNQNTVSIPASTHHSKRGGSSTRRLSVRAYARPNKVVRSRPVVETPRRPVPMATSCRLVGGIAVGSFLLFYLFFLVNQMAFISDTYSPGKVVRSSQSDAAGTSAVFGTFVLFMNYLKDVYGGHAKMTPQPPITTNTNKPSLRGHIPVLNLEPKTMGDDSYEEDNDYYSDGTNPKTLTPPTKSSDLTAQVPFKQDPVISLSDVLKMEYPLTPFSTATFDFDASKHIVNPENALFKSLNPLHTYTCRHNGSASLGGFGVTTQKVFYIGRFLNQTGSFDPFVGEIESGKPVTVTGMTEIGFFILDGGSPGKNDNRGIIDVSIVPVDATSTDETQHAAVNVNLHIVDPWPNSFKVSLNPKNHIEIKTEGKASLGKLGLETTKIFYIAWITSGRGSFDPYVGSLTPDETATPRRIGGASRFGFFILDSGIPGKNDNSGNMKLILLESDPRN